MVPLHASIDAFCLDAPVHPQERPLRTVQVGKHFFMEPGQFPVDPDLPVFFAFPASFGERAAFTALTFEEFFRSDRPVRLPLPA